MYHAYGKSETFSVSAPTPCEAPVGWPTGGDGLRLADGGDERDEVHVDGLRLAVAPHRITPERRGDERPVEGDGDHGGAEGKPELPESRPEVQTPASSHWRRRRARVSAPASAR